MAEVKAIQDKSDAKAKDEGAAPEGVADRLTDTEAHPGQTTGTRPDVESKPDKG